MRRGPRARGPATCCGPCSTRGSATSRWASAGARRPTAARACCARSGAEVSDDLATVDLERPRPAPVGDAAADRLRRDQPAARADRRGRRLRPAEGRVARARWWRSTCAAPGSRMPWSGRAGRRERDTPGAGAAGGVGFAMLTLAGQFAELELRPGVDLVMEEAGFDRALASVAARDHRGGADRRPDRLRQDGARRREAGAGGRRPCIAIGGGVTPEGVVALAGGRRDRGARSSRRRRTSRRRWPRARRRSSGAASEWRGCSARRSDVAGRDAAPVVSPGTARAARPAAAKPNEAEPKKREPRASPTRSRPGPTTLSGTGRGCRATSSTS